MKQEWRLQGKKAKAGFGTPLLWLSVLPLSSSLRPLPGLELAEAGPAWIQGWRGASKAGSSQSPLWQEQRGEGVAHSDLAQVP